MVNGLNHHINRSVDLVRERPEEAQRSPGCLKVKSIRLLLIALGLLLAACGDDTTVNEAGVGLGATRPLTLTSPGDTPPVDRATASVELADIVFDTFDGGSVTLEEASDGTIDRLFDAIAPIDAPEYETPEDADWLEPGDVVLGYTDPDGGAWAYPVRILNGHEIVNDELGGQPVLISYCPLCGSGVVYDRVLNGQELSFSNTSALLDNDMVMVDRESGSYWWQVAGSAVVGPLVDQELTILPSQITTLESWVAQHPDTAIMERPTGRSYRDSFSSYNEVLDSGRTPFPLRDDTLGDNRLPASTPVVYATIGDVDIAWNPAPAREFTETVDGVELEVQTDGLGVTVLRDGESVPTRASFWFAALTVFPDIVLSNN